eukprot:Nk52_evm59s153 gene=Nk52_evmTU59s153
MEKVTTPSKFYDEQIINGHAGWTGKELTNTERAKHFDAFNSLTFNRGQYDLLDGFGKPVGLNEEPVFDLPPRTMTIAMFRAGGARESAEGIYIACFLSVEMNEKNYPLYDSKNKIARAFMIVWCEQRLPKLPHFDVDFVQNIMVHNPGREREQKHIYENEDPPFFSYSHFFAIKGSVPTTIPLECIACIQVISIFGTYIVINLDSIRPTVTAAQTWSNHPFHALGLDYHANDFMRRRISELQRRQPNMQTFSSIMYRLFRYDPKNLFKSFKDGNPRVDRNELTRFGQPRTKIEITNNGIDVMIPEFKSEIRRKKMFGVVVAKYGAVKDVIILNIDARIIQTETDSRGKRKFSVTFPAKRRSKEQDRSLTNSGIHNRPLELAHPDFRLNWPAKPGDMEYFFVTMTPNNAEPEEKLNICDNFLVAIILGDDTYHKTIIAEADNGSGRPADGQSETTISYTARTPVDMRIYDGVGHVINSVALGIGSKSENYAGEGFIFLVSSNYGSMSVEEYTAKYNEYENRLRRHKKPMDWEVKFDGVIGRTDAKDDDKNKKTIDVVPLTNTPVTTCTNGFSKDPNICKRHRVPLTAVNIDVSLMDDDSNVIIAIEYERGDNKSGMRKLLCRTFFQKGSNEYMKVHSVVQGHIISSESISNPSVVEKQFLNDIQKNSLVSNALELGQEPTRCNEDTPTKGGVFYFQYSLKKNEENPSKYELTGKYDTAIQSILSPAPDKDGYVTFTLPFVSFALCKRSKMQSISDWKLPSFRSYYTIGTQFNVFLKIREEFGA